MSIGANISSKQLRLLFGVLVLISISLLLGTYIVNHQGIRLNKYLRLLLLQSDLGSENIFAAWFSSMLLFCSVIFSFTCFILDKRRFTRGWKYLLNYGWLILAGCFAALSFDEMGSIHEYIGDYAAFKSTGEVLIKEENSGWTIFYYLVGAVSLFMLFFSLLRLRRSGKSLLFFIAGILCYLTNPVQENFEIANYGSGVVQRPLYLLLLEEGSELLGSLCFLASACTYAAFSSSKLFDGLRPGEIKVTISLSKKTLVFYLLLLLVGCGAVLTLLTYMFGYVKGENQVGVPKNWIPSMLGFLIFAYCLYMGVNYKNKRRAYLVLSILAITISIFYGCDKFADLLPAFRYSAETGYGLLSLIGIWLAYLQNHAWPARTYPRVNPNIH